MEYRKKIDLDPNTNYWFVEMGELNFLNGGSNYPFTNETAARLFATNHKYFARMEGIDRAIRIRFPDGSIEEIP